MDKLESEVHCLAPLAPELADLLDSICRGNRSGIHGIAGGRHYEFAVDLRKNLGVPVIWHYGLKRGHVHNHKAEILDSGERSFDQNVSILEKLLRGVDPLTLRVMRLDLCADVRDVGVSWFVHHLRAARKQWGCKHGRLVLEFSEMGRREIQTYYLGRRPNCIRVYDKFAEVLGRYLRLDASEKRRIRATAAFLGADGVRSEEFDLDALIAKLDQETADRVAPWHGITRVERQISSTRMPKELKVAPLKVAALPDDLDYSDDVDDQDDDQGDEQQPLCDVSALWNRLRISDPEHPRFFNPFSSCEVHADGVPDSFLLEYRKHFKRSDWLKGMGLRSAVRLMGFQNAYLDANKHGNAKEEFKKYAVFMPTDQDCGVPAEYQHSVTLSPEKLRDTYIASMSKQMAC